MPDNLSADAFRDLASAARVYPAKEANGWVVESPQLNGSRHRETFKGPRAQVMALEFAYRSYGKARFFPR